MRRVAVTGVGVVSAFGNDFESFWQGVSTGSSAIRPMQPVPPGPLRFPNAAQAIHFAPSLFFEEKEASLLDRFALMGAVAAREAVRASGLDFGSSNGLRERSAVVMGSSGGGKSSEDEGFEALYARGEPRISPLTIPRAMANAAASRISVEHGITGPVFAITTACSSSNHAIGQAFWLVRNGVADAAIAGGSEAPFSFGFLKAWEAMRVISPDTCRPFSKDRRGLILGEGAAALVLEPLDAARARGAIIWAEICGFGMSSDAHHITQPSVEGAALAIAAALSDASAGPALAPEQIGYINAHGTGTPANDATETAALRAAFGSHAERLLVSSTKSMHGHALGAAGALEAAATVAALRFGTIPPTANFTEPDPACDLDVVANRPRSIQAEAAASNSFAFGGLNAVLVFRCA
jgi:nodulation protein E